MTAVEEAAGEGGGHEAVLAELRRTRVNVHAFWGVGPLVVAVVLLVLMMLIAPSVAPERVVERPVGATTTTTAEPGPGTP